MLAAGTSYNDFKRNHHVEDGRQSTAACTDDDDREQSGAFYAHPRPSRPPRPITTVMGRWRAARRKKRTNADGHLPRASSYRADNKIVRRNKCAASNGQRAIRGGQPPLPLRRTGANYRPEVLKAYRARAVQLSQR